MKSGKNDNDQLVSVKELQRQIGESKIKLAILQANLKEDNDNAGLEEPVLTAVQQAAIEKRALSAIRSEVQRLSKKTRREHNIPRFLRVVAAALLLCFISLGTAMAVSSEVRIMVMKLLYKVTPQYTEISLVPDEEASFGVPSGWKGEYYPSFIPDDYTFSGIQETSFTRDAIYLASNGRFLRFTENEGTVEISVDTEGYHTQDIVLNGNAALLAEKDDKCKVIWQQSAKILTLTITESFELAIEIAERVTRIR